MAYGICQRCGWKKPLRQIHAEWTSLRVCNECFDERPADMSPPKIGPEGQPLPNALPERPEVSAPFDFLFDGALFDTGEVTEADL